MSDPVFKIYNSYIAPGSELSCSIGSNNLRFRELFLGNSAHLSSINLLGVLDMNSNNLIDVSYIYGINTTNYIFMDSAGSGLNLTINATTGLFSLKSGSSMLLSGTNIFIYALSNVEIGSATKYLRIKSDGSLYANGYYYNRTTVAGNYTARLIDDVIYGNATNGSIVISLQSSVLADRKKYSFFKTDISANTVTVDANGAELINNATSVVLSNQYDTTTIVSNGSQWYIL